MMSARAEETSKFVLLYFFRSQYLATVAEHPLPTRHEEKLNIFVYDGLIFSGMLFLLRGLFDISPGQRCRIFEFTFEKTDYFV